MKKQSKYIIEFIAIVIQAMIMFSVGYGIRTWQYWAILIVTCVYGFLVQLQRGEIVMVKLNDILSIMEPAQYLRIYVGDIDDDIKWISMTAYAALKVITHKTQQRNVMSIKFCDGSVFIYLEQEQEKNFQL